MVDGSKVAAPADRNYSPAFKQYISDLGRVCRDETFHAEYRMDFKFSETPSSDDTDGTATKMDVSINHVYLYMVITVYPDCLTHFEEGDFKRLSRFMLHEACHLFFQPVQDLYWWDVCTSQKSHCVQTLERQVERVSHALWAMMPKDWYLPERVSRTPEAPAP